MSIVLPATVDRVLLTGASGAIGQHFLALLLSLGAQVTCLVRNEATARTLREKYGKERGERLQFIEVDLRREQSVAELAGRLGRAKRWMVVHSAADVSWTKPRRLLEDVNVRGTVRVAELAIACSRLPPVFVFLSTAFIGPGGQTRNAYEATKLEAETILQERLAARMRVTIVRCSLVVGRSSDGAIGRFNGIYPLLRVISTGELPCLIAQPDYRIDAVPIEIVAREVLACARASENAPQPVRSVIAAGTRAIEIAVFVRTVRKEANRFRAENGLESLPEMSIISARQYRFLMQASGSWGLRERFRKVEQLSNILDGYIVHGESFRAIQPAMITPPPPDLESYLPVIVRFWLEKNAELIRSAPRPLWLTGETT